MCGDSLIAKQLKEHKTDLHGNQSSSQDLRQHRDRFISTEQVLILSRDRVECNRCFDPVEEMLLQEKERSGALFASYPVAHFQFWKFVSIPRK